MHDTPAPTQDLGGAPDGGKPWKRKCRSILNALMAHRYSWPFMAPVKKSEAPGYYDIILSPMDIGTVMARLESDIYQARAAAAAAARSNAAARQPASTGAYRLLRAHARMRACAALPARACACLDLPPPQRGPLAWLPAPRNS